MYPTPQLDLGGYKHGWLISDEICLRYRREKNLQPSKTASPTCAKIAHLGRFVLMRCAILPSQMVFAPVAITLKKHTKNKEGEMKDYLFKILKPRKNMKICIALTLLFIMGKGPFGNIEMGGMFTVVKVRDNLRSYDKDPGWYKHPKGTVAYRSDQA